MKIINHFNKDQKVFSFEFFPPKDEKGEEQLFKALETLKELKPHFVSVTYGAMGRSQDRTLSIVTHIKKNMGLEVMSHFTCIGLTEEKVDSYLQSLRAVGIDNVLALRGDIPKDMPRETALKGAYQYANNLVASIREKTKDYFGITVAGYPEGHPEAPSLEKDLDHLKMKVDAGADFVVTQLFYNNEDFYRFRDQAIAKGITVPIVPGVMPIQSFKQIEVIAKMCGAKIPAHIRDFYTKDDLTKEEQIQFGIDFATQQCQDLLTQGASGIHFYTLNRAKVVKTVYEQLAAFHAS